jgi:hypothetical protein
MQACFKLIQNEHNTLKLTVFNGNSENEDLLVPLGVPVLQFEKCWLSSRRVLNLFYRL